MDPVTGYISIQNPNKENSPKGFTFDAVYDQYSTQKMVYDETAFPLVESVLDGFNGTIFAYGQTGCGKTWTMSGEEDDDTVPLEKQGRNRGIIPNSFEHIFNSIKLKGAELKDKGAADCEFLVRASYLEIYNEEIRDLLSEDPKKKLELKETPDKGVFVKDLQFEVVENRDQINRVLQKGTDNRTVAETLMNSVSSRSHSIFGVVIEVNEVDDTGKNHFRAGKLNLVDLAGSERQSKTGSSGDRLKEGCKINLSLSALGNVISALVDGKDKHIPYRDSKLTRLLQDSLGGNTKTVMISAVSPADYNFEETMSTLRYANRAKNIKNKPVINEDPKDTMLREYKDEIENLKKLLAQQGSTPLPESRKDTLVVQEKVVEKVVEKEIVMDQKVAAENRALQDYSQAIEEQRNRLGAELDRKQQEIEKRNEEQRNLEAKLKKLQSQVLGHGKAGNVDDAKKEREIRKAQAKLKQQQRKEAELLVAKERAEEEKRVIEEECKNAHGVAETKEKALKALKKSMTGKIDKVKGEMRELEHEFQEERESLLETIREQSRELKRLDQVVDLFLPFTERSKMWELSIWNEEEEEWRLPKLKPRSGIQALSLPGLNGEMHGGLEVDEVRRKKSVSKPRHHPHEESNADDSREERRPKSSRKEKREKQTSLDEQIRGNSQLEDRPKSRKKSRDSGQDRPKSRMKSKPEINEWPIQDAPLEEDPMKIPSYGDRCQSRQGRRKRNELLQPL